jgi:RNA polymerase sigma-70 factor (ECF subfamily)
VLRADAGPQRPGASALVHGAEEVASRALMFSRLAPFVRPALINGTAGVVVARGREPFSVMGFTVRGGRIVEIDAVADPERLARVDLTLLDED